MRHLISLLIAVVASVAGSLMLWIGGGRALFEMSRFGLEGGVAGPMAVAVAGALLLGIAAFSIRFSPAGPLVVGAFTALGPLLMVLLPYDPFRGVNSPIVSVLDSLDDVDRGLAIGAFDFVAFGTAALIGFALLGAGILARPRPAGALWRVLSAVGGVVALGFAGWAFAAGADFYRRSFVVLDPSVLAGASLLVAAVLFGAAIAPSGRSSIGAWIAGGVLTLAGALLLVVPPQAFSVLPPELLTGITTLGWSGQVLAVGLTLLGLALGVALRPVSQPRPQAPQPQQGAAPSPGVAV